MILRNVLTGVIESPDTLQLVARTYIKTLVWYLIIALSENAKRRKKDDDTHEEANAAASASPGDHVVQFNDDGNEDDGGNAASPAFVFPSSASVDGVQLDEWPSSEESPEQQQQQRSRLLLVRTAREEEEEKQEEERMKPWAQKYNRYWDRVAWCKTNTRKNRYKNTRNG